MPTTVAVVLAGGRGTRLYPASTDDTPKQFRAFGGDRSLLSRAVERARAVADETYVLTRPAYADRIHEHAPGVAVLTEPEPKDTGPALVYAAHRIREQVTDPVLLCLPSDHHVGDGYRETFARACEVARETGGLVTLGVEPTRTATEYGYIKPGEDRGGYHPVEAFKEKPDPGGAARYREHGYLWNAGVFAWTPDALLDAARAGELGAFVDALGADPEGAFAAVDPVSVDYAVMEEAENAYVVPAAFDWDDLGSWDALERMLDPDASGTVSLGETLAVDTEDCVLAAGDGQHVAAVGVNDLVVATYDGRTLVAPKREAQRVREVVAALDD
ncbi:mannose-1-phosphate guanylyltransferase [Halorarius halobius]|uniref:mannose-1-phosphate guanylyltransferase n=1 Tax=Halorarius halobius TaxID=2962671 RepID=UPI0020CF71B0|nr:sugar phosphate nucleotidyltransferase [Halorarius halobius]